MYLWAGPNIRSPFFLSLRRSNLFSSQQPPPFPRCPNVPRPCPSLAPLAEAHHSELWGLPVKELKQRLKAVGSDVRGVTEKTELIILLEQLTEKSPSEGLLL